MQTRAELDGDEWVVNGQKVWTSGAEWSDWSFVVCRTDPDAQPRHRGISYLLVPMDQPGVDIRPIVQMTGDAEFSETFFSDARTARGQHRRRSERRLGCRDGDARVRARRLDPRPADELPERAERDHRSREGERAGEGPADPPADRARLERAPDQRYHALRTLAGVEEGAEPPPSSSITKIFWASWHRDLGKLAMDVLGPEAELADGASPYALNALQRLFLFTRSDTIYAGSNQIQRNIISERTLGLPREPR